MLEEVFFKIPSSKHLGRMAKPILCYAIEKITVIYISLVPLGIKHIFF